MYEMYKGQQGPHNLPSWHYPAFKLLCLDYMKKKSILTEAHLVFAKLKRDLIQFKKFHR